MALPKSKEKKIKRLNDQLKKHQHNTKMVANIKQRIRTLENTK